MPASKPYRFHPQAWQEVEAAESWYRQRNPEASVRFLSAIYDALERLARCRSAGQPIGMEHDGSFFTASRFPSSIDEDTSVSVVAIAHHKRRSGYWKDRL